jgi:hypothetical protein
MSAKSGNPSDPRRAERLKAALRSNLKRRKAQERGRGQLVKKRQPAVRPPEGEDPAATDR